MKKVLIDSNYLCHKAKVTTGTLSHSGQPTGIIFGFFNQLITIAKTTGAQEFLFFWDSRKSKRREIYPEYKMQRRPDLTEWEKEEWEFAFEQFKRIRRQILPRIGFHNNHLQVGYEADDLLAKYAMNNSEHDLIIASADNDLLQLLDYADFLNLSKNKMITQKSFIEEYGLQPRLWGEVKKIAGCASDNVKGIQGVGEATAIRFLKGSLPETHKIYQKIIDGIDIIARNHELVVLPFKDTQPIKEVPNAFKITEFIEVCKELGMESFLTQSRKEDIKNLFLKERKTARWQRKHR